ncbi:MAG: hypothetical protein M1833_007324 [Piccolia ochrophora]|nr:MAG: hypothetical protein M1833_007324 [Piccolia ochrophora]
MFGSIWQILSVVLASLSCVYGAATHLERRDWGLIQCYDYFVIFGQIAHSTPPRAEAFLQALRSGPASAAHGRVESVGSDTVGVTLASIRDGLQRFARSQTRPFCIVPYHVEESGSSPGPTHQVLLSQFPLLHTTFADYLGTLTRGVLGRQPFSIVFIGGNAELANHLSLLPRDTAVASGPRDGKSWSGTLSRLSPGPTSLDLWYSYHVDVPLDGSNDPFFAVVGRFSIKANDVFDRFISTRRQVKASALTMLADAFGNRKELERIADSMTSERELQISYEDKNIAIMLAFASIFSTTVTVPRAYLGPAPGFEGFDTDEDRTS